MKQEQNVKNNSKNIKNIYLPLLGWVKNRLGSSDFLDWFELASTTKTRVLISNMPKSHTAHIFFKIQYM